MKITIQERMYYSQTDENAFFQRLYDMTCVKEVVGDADGLNIRFRRPPNNDQLRDLIALLFRYDLDMTPLAALRTARNAAWFDKSNMFWHKRVFGSRTRGRKRKF